MSKPKRFAIVGTGSRAGMYIEAILKTFRDDNQLVAYCDINQGRMDHTNRTWCEKLGTQPVPTYRPADFARMLRDQRVDTVIVTSVDRTHHRYIIDAMENGCDVISEKPLTTDAEKCQEVLDTVERTGRKLRVTFNYRYSPLASCVKTLLQEGVIGTPQSVHFEWLLDTNHGADYFRRWHRDRANSGGLMVHKATHHFDLVNWWLGSRPESVFGFGGLRFYGRENAEKRGVSEFYERATGNPVAANDPFALHLDKHAWSKAMYLEAEKHDGYIRDQSVFGNGISIEDDMAVAVRYESGATMSYHLTAYSPWEGYRIAFNGTKGRLELDKVETAWCQGPEDPALTELLSRHQAVDEQVSERLVIRPHWGKPRTVTVPAAEGGHGGGDERLLHDLFVGGIADPLGRAADHIDGAMSILTGIAANRSFATGAVVRTRDLVTIRRERAAVPTALRAAAAGARS
ncbi:MAG: Gfo/Idh/MocA family oxidoreductase [Planctomycetes bacterium]|nr:Gfo/Idh/MocA family oxidoreductase [Planctomycetota bacterium]